ncbi:MAG: hypothetical protein HC824_22485 [Synechococcales cyanobacterium RM1_1_8]|nr:hypothetical protein [Synechococcales cyanobacterium RM1_1_8]
MRIQGSDSLVLRRNSGISATAGLVQARDGSDNGSGGNGSGGNITISANTILALPSENSDITANAARNQGGAHFPRGAIDFGVGI